MSTLKIESTVDIHSKNTVDKDTLINVHMKYAIYYMYQRLSDGLIRSYCSLGDISSYSQVEFDMQEIQLETSVSCWIHKK